MTTTLIAPSVAPPPDQSRALGLLPARHPYDAPPPDLHRSVGLLPAWSGEDGVWRTGRDPRNGWYSAWCVEACGCVVRLDIPDAETEEREREFFGRLICWHHKPVAERLRIEGLRKRDWDR